MISPRRSISFTLAVVFLALLPTSASAYFERLFVSTRVQSMGGAFVSVADDPGAIIYNPAGLTQISSVSVLSTYSRPYGLSDLGEYFLALTTPTRIGSFGFSWHRFALENVTSEDLFTFAFGRDLIRTSQDASFSVGGSLDIAHVSYSDYFSKSKTAITGSLSFLLRPFPVIGVGYAIRNIGEPSIDFSSETAGVGGSSNTSKTPLEMTHTFGFVYHWERRFSVLYERERGQDGRWRDRIGVEVVAGDHLRLRSGLLGGDVTGGIGVIVSNVWIDAGVTGHEVLGLSYLVSVGISLPRGGNDEKEEW